MPTKTDQTLEIPRPHPLLTLSIDQVARLTRPARAQRVELLLQESRRIFDAGVDEQVVDAGKDLVGVAVLFSGGNDSTVLAHAFRDLVDLAIHANTGVGIEATREFVRETCRSWGLPLDERHPPRPYSDLVLEAGFPGPGQHFKMFQRLKERSIMAARADLVTRPTRQRLVFLAGRRRDESLRREAVPLWEREGSTLWISPLAYWTKLDLNTYRQTRRVPVNEVSEVLHMSGECLCGSFAKVGEREQIRSAYPGTFAGIEELEEKLDDEDRPEIPPVRRRWGWGVGRKASDRGPLAGTLCGSCVDDPLPFEL